MATIAGEEGYDVLTLGTIPAIGHPMFVTGAAASSQMQPEELELGIMVDVLARAYSLWQPDAREIVNNFIAKSAIAATC